ncbi:MAG: DUF296 domain-containing protein, partial [Clostridiales bacterium]|nr:DUF296 domain-containing protein [Clostridiales bacterium]
LKTHSYENEAFEISGLDGFIADGKPHIHFTLGSADKVLSGHAGPGNKILYIAEIIICEVCGLTLTRSPNEKGINTLRYK